MSAVEQLCPPKTYDYVTDATRACDIVMKGGITSGVVYPLAICELAERFRFRSIGGTSAGAIAAAAAAAAECGRARGDGGAGFRELETLPDWLGAPGSGRSSNLLALFQPQPETRAVFETAMAGIPRWKRIPLAAVRRFPLGALAGAAPGLALAALLALDWSRRLVPALVLALAFAVVGALGGAVVALGRRALRVLPATGFGLCSGNGSADALTPWLGDLVDRLAGKTDPAEPLTFGDLAAANVNLAMMTTCLSLGQPYRLPFAWGGFAPNESTFFFSGAELRRYFPERIVAWMEAHGAAADPPGADRVLHRLPDAHALPVVVAARLSLSFPVLLSALPLYVWDWTTQGYTRVWFSDGGITSNFPVHFFDAPLPRWPTVAIDLRGPRRRRADLRVDALTAERERVWMIEQYDEPLQDSLQTIRGLKDFLFAIKDTAQNWMDNAQLRVPGWRDRVANIGFEAGEGGLNLAMSATVIRRLACRGRRAGDLLADRFAAQPASAPISWYSHRWVRYRTSMATLAPWLGELGAGWAGDPEYDRLLRREAGEPPAYAAWAPGAQQGEAVADTEALVALVERWGDAAALAEGAPAPAPVLRATPSV